MILKPQLQTKLRYVGLILLVAILLTPVLPSPLFAQEPQGPPEDAATSSISLADDMGTAVRREMTRVSEQFQQKALSLFERTPIGWDTDTLDYLYQWALSLPLRLPEFMAHILEQGRMLGVVGSLLVLTLLGAIFYTLFGQKRVMAKVEAAIQPYRSFLPETAYPYVLSLLRTGVGALIPLLLLGAFSLINAFITYHATWFLLTGRLLGVWALSALAIYVFHESLTKGLFSSAEQYGPTIYKRARLVVFYIAGGTAIYWGAEAGDFPPDVLAFLKFAITLSVVVLLLLLFYNKTALMSLFPELPYPFYERFIRNLDRYYSPVMYATFITGVMWCFGYQRLCSAIWTKTWAVAGVFVGFFIVYHFVLGKLNKWASEKAASQNEDAVLFFKSLKLLLLYVTITSGVIIILDLLGAMNSIERAFSFPILAAGGKELSFWVILKAVLVFLAFSFGSGLLRSYLGYKVYPTIGVDTGLAYAMNTFIRYLILCVAGLSALRILGLSLKVLMIFAGAAGIGVGLGLQSLTSNIISGLTLVFGQKIRRGDWLQVGDTIGVVTDIYLRATKLKTRDDIEYLIPNSDFISSTVVNYSLSSPNIRLAIDVGVSYDADPREVERILVASASRHPEISRIRKPEVRFVGYGDNSINFQVLVWIDVRSTARRMARSLFYYTAFEALKTEGIEIPFPQRDLHIRSGLVPAATPSIT